MYTLHLIHLHSGYVLLIAYLHALHASLGWPDPGSKTSPVSHLLSLKCQDENKIKLCLQDKLIMNEKCF